ncbi:MAG: class I SAM-dependent methyltransferase, partial [Planctomycetota bacterium]
KGLVICIDKWEPYYEPFQREQPGPYRQMHDALSSGKIFELFIHNIKATGHDDVIIAFRGWSDNLLPLLGSDRFDLVFIDGNHAYTGVLKDIESSARLVSEGGIMCGDDLELQLYQLDVQYAKEHKQKDYVTDPKTGKEYHPGVSLAVGEFFGEVSVWEGFWAMRKNMGHWEKVELPITTSQCVAVPEHLMEQRVSNYLQFGQELYKAQRMTQAKEAFLQAHMLMPDSANVHKALAVVYWKLENLPKATEHMQCLFQLEPDNPGVKMNHNQMMELLQGKGSEKGQHQKNGADEIPAPGSPQGRYCCSQGAP